MPDSTVNEYFDQPLNNVSISYQNDQMFATRIFPVVPTPQQSGAYYLYGKEKFQQYETARAAKAEAREIAPWSLNAVRFYAQGKALKDLISDEEVANNMLGEDLEINTTENLTDAILLDLELGVANLVTTSSSIGNATLSGTSQWSDFVNSDPVAAVRAQRLAIKKKIVKYPNVFAVSSAVHEILIQHPKITDRFKFNNAFPGIVTEEMFKAVFGVDEYWILGAEYLTSNEGQTPVLDFVWGKNAFLAYIPPSPRRREIALRYIFQWLYGAPGLTKDMECTL